MYRAIVCEEVPPREILIHLPEDPPTKEVLRRLQFV